MKAMLFVTAILLSLNVSAEEDKSEDMLRSENSIINFSAQLAGAGSGIFDERIYANCSCSCTGQGVLIQTCDGKQSNLGDYGSSSKCNDAKKTHPGCK